MCGYGLSLETAIENIQLRRQSGNDSLTGMAASVVQDNCGEQTTVREVPRSLQRCLAGWIEEVAEMRFLMIGSTIILPTSLSARLRKLNVNYLLVFRNLHFGIDFLHGGQIQGRCQIRRAD